MRSVDAARVGANEFSYGSRRRHPRGSRLTVPGGLAEGSGPSCQLSHLSKPPPHGSTFTYHSTVIEAKVKRCAIEYQPTSNLSRVTSFVRLPGRGTLFGDSSFSVTRDANNIPEQKAAGTGKAAELSGK